MAAELATPEAMAFFVKHGTGIVCVSMKEEDLERLQLPLMVPSKDNEEKLCTAFTVTVVRNLSLGRYARFGVASNSVLKESLLSIFTK